MSAINNLAVLLVCLLVLSLSGCINLAERGKSSYKAKAPYNNKTRKRVYTVNGETYRVLPNSNGYLEIGIASWYGKKFHGRLTANGEIYDMYKMTAAHKSLPLPSLVRITNLDNGEKIVVRVNDRGPFVDDRLIDLSYKAATKLGFVDKGTAPVVVEALNGNFSRTEEGNFSRTESKTVSRQSGPDITSKLITDRTPGNMSYYLQLGAFTRLKSARQLMGKIDALIGSHEVLNVDVRILQSELPENTLHKVWIGPIKEQSKRDLIALWVEELKLGSPIKVDIN